MMEKNLRGRGRTAASLVATVALFGGAAAVTTGPAQSAEPAGDCTEAFPLAELATGDPVTGLTVSKGTTPEGFTGEILGVIEDGIAPGLDMIMADLDSPALDAAGGIWQGMSGSPVYAEDGRLIGAVAYGLSWGPSKIAGITPFEEMDNYLPDAPAARVKVSDATARRIAARSDATAAQADDGFSQLRMPLGVSGVGSRRLAQADEMRKDHKFLPKNTYAMGAAAAPGAGADASTIIAGGNLAVSMSYGDITQGGVGTATSICDGGVVGFGHPATFLGTTTMSLHPADALFVQPESLGAPFKVANLGAPVGTISDDHLSGVSGTFGPLPATATITSDLSYRDRQRTGSSFVSVPESNAAVTFYQQIANHDRVIDGIIAGSELMTWSITGDDHGTPFTLSMTDRYASNYDIAFESPWEVADLVWFLSAFEGVTVEEVTVDGDVSDDSSTWQVDRVEQRRDGAWMKVSRRVPARATAGKTLKLRAVLDGPGDTTKVVPLALDIPAKAAGSGGMLAVEGGAWQWTNYWEATDVDDIADALASAVRNDAVSANLFIEGRRKMTRVTDVTEPTDKVVYGAKRVTVRIR